MGKVRIVEMQFTNLAGELKSVDVTYQRFKDSMRLGKCIDGSSVNLAPLEKSDLVLKPIMGTYFVVPWNDGRTARVLCDLFRPAEITAQFGREEEYELSPRFILKRNMAAARKEGYDFITSAEMEFFILKDRKIVDQATYFAPPPYDRETDLRRNIFTTLENLGVSAEFLHHEVATSQYEISLTHDDALRCADNVMAFKYIAKNLAAAAGMSLTFMPKPFAGMNGSGMHIHMSLKRGTENLFYGKEKLSRLAKYFVAGVLSHAKALSAVVGPTLNSYKRLVAGYEAPVYISWGYMNRSTMIRIPSFNAKKSARLELRTPDPMCNPYLAMAALLASGLDGIKEHKEPGDAMSSNAFEQEGLEKLPGTLKEALKCLKSDQVITEAFGEPAVNKYVEIKTREYNDYEKANLIWDPTTITEWETDRYLELL
jgi:glutamine synthetase